MPWIFDLIDEYFVFCGKLTFGISRFDPFQGDLTFDTQEVDNYQL